MTNAILVLNAGSSSVKFALFEDRSEPPLILKGSVSGIGSDARIKVKKADGTETLENDLEESAVKNPTDALSTIMDTLSQMAPDIDVTAVGHRVVHGGVEFDDCVMGGSGDFSG